MFIGYVFYYLARNSFTYAKPLLIEHLDFEKTSLGFLGTTFFVIYGLSKFVSGIISDRSNPRYFMAIGLMISGMLNLCLGLTTSLYFFALFLAMNGWFQGFGWPPCARLLTHWYSQNERGSWWSTWNVSHNIGGFLIPVVVAYIGSKYGLQFAFYIPGIVCILMGLFLINRLRDTPESLGLPPIEEFRNDRHEKRETDSSKQLSVKEILFKYVLNNPAIWLLAVAYFFVSMVRIGMVEWSQLFLMEVKGYNIASASFGPACFEIGGFFGSLSAGWISDRVFGARRGPVNAIFAIGMFISMLFLWYMPPLFPTIDYAMMFCIGFSVFGPQMMIGMAAAELSHKKAAATATGFAGWIGYFGGAFAGGPLGKITQDWGWEGFLWVMVTCALVSALLLLSLWSTAPSAEEAYA
jgi:OPA family sugar phosphate sensor protein UhpC-like MFS transporter